MGLRELIKETLGEQLDKSLILKEDIAPPPFKSFSITHPSAQVNGASNQA